MRALLTALLIAFAASAANAAVVQWTDGPGANGHYYEFVRTRQTFDDAFAAAASRTHAGRQGHLLTITSAEEAAFVATLMGNRRSTWLAASDGVVEGQFVWLAGPERLMPVIYANWEPGTLDRSTSAKDHVLFNARNTYWTDVRNRETLRKYYLVEYSETIAAVPLPASGVTLLSALGGLAWAGRRRTR